MRLFGSHVAYRAVDKAQPRLNCPFADRLDLFGVFKSLDMLVSAEFEIDAVGIIDHFLREVIADELRKIAPDLGAEGQLPVGERACAGEAGGYVAVRLAVDALLGSALGAAAVFDSRALVKHDNFLLRAFPYHLKSREYSRRSGSDYYYIGVHTVR